MARTDILNYLTAAGHSAPSADNAQPWQFQWDGHHLSISYDHERVDGTTFPETSQATLLTMGAVIENLFQAASALGMTVRQEASLAENSTKEFLRLPIHANLAVPNEARQHPLFQRHTNRLAYKSQALPESILHDIHKFQEGNAKLKIINEKKQIHGMANLVRSASEVRFQTPEIHEWLSRSLRFTQEEVASGDGLDVATFDLPPGGRIILRVIREWHRMAKLNKIGAYKLLSLIEAMPVSKAPALILISGTPNRETILDAGRLMERAWIELNRSGIAVQPYYVVPDQLERLENGVVPVHLINQVKLLRQDVVKFLDSEKETLFMLLRIGLPKTHPVRSIRLPIASVFQEKI